MASEFTDPVNDIKVIQLNRPLQALGKLCSLLFVRQIEAGFEDYSGSQNCTSVLHFLLQ